MGNPLISVVLPVFNGEKYIKEAIDSILVQSFEDFELIIVNDGSTDSSEAIILNYQDRRIRYFKQENSGVGKALQYGCSVALGRYVARMDADDICFPNRFLLQKQYLETHPGTVLVSSAVQYIDASGAVTGRSFPYIFNYSICKKLNTINPVCHPAVMMRMVAYQKSIGYRDVQPFEDHLLWISMAGLGKLHNFSFPLLQYRVLDNSVSRDIPEAQHRILFRFLLDKLKTSGLGPDEISEYRKLYHAEKIKIVAPSTMHEPSSDRDKTLSPGSVKQASLLQVLEKLRLPEPVIERFICTCKSIFLIFP